MTAPRRRQLLSVLLLLTLTACSGGGGEEPRTLVITSEAGVETVAGADGTDGGEAAPGPAKDEGRGGKGGKGDGGAGGPTGAGPGDGEQGGEGGKGDGAASGSEEGQGSGPGKGSGGRGSGDGDEEAGFTYPAAGTYTYRRSGYRKICGGSACDKEKLPQRQDIVTRLTQETDSSAVVVSEEETEDSYFRSTTRFTSEGAFVLELHTRFSYGGFEFEDTYRPDPPVASLRFPLEVGNRWAGRWKADVSGSYKARVLAREGVALPWGDVQAVKVFSHTEFEGDFEGSADTTVWVDLLRERS